MYPSNRRGAVLSENRERKEGRGLFTSPAIFLASLVALLAFASWWQVNMSCKTYHGPRWIGLWDNPNVYGILMGVGATLAIGLLAEEGKTKTVFCIFLSVAVFMMSVGLVCSYCRGAWFGTAVGLLYFAKAYKQWKWRWVLLFVAVAAAVMISFWGQTADSAPWYIKRLDFGRPSAQHRVAAWCGALQMMWDHPFGVGWNNAVAVYQEKYSPPENGAAAITTNDYLMLGTQLGWPALLCFVTYVGLCLRGKNSKLKMQNEERRKAESEKIIESKYDEEEELYFDITEGARLRIACRAGAVVFLVAFWFDGGLFTLATGSVFWVLLELGVEPRMRGPAGSLLHGSGGTY